MGKIRDKTRQDARRNPAFRFEFDKYGSQRCVCRKCNFNYTLNPKYPEELKQEAIRLYKAGMSGREVGRILNINKASVINWVRKYDGDIT